MSYNIKKIIMAESSDIYHDGRVLKQANALFESGYDVSVFGFRSFNTKKNQYPFNIITIPTLSKKFRKLRYINIFLNILIISIIILFKKAKVYHSHNTMFLPAMFISSKIYKSLLVYDSHEIQWELNRISGIIENIFIKKIRHIIHVSKGRAIETEKRYNLSKDSITVISNYPQVPNNLTPINYVPKETLSFVFSGGFDLNDNKLDNFILALKYFKECQFKLLAFGYGDSFEKLKKTIKNLNLQNQVEFMSLVKPSEVIATIQKFDIAVNLLTNPKNLISYKYHGINKVYEYLLAGLPILCSNMPSFINDFEKNNIGKSVNPYNIESIREGIQYFIDNKNDLNTIKKRARRIAISEFNWNTQKKKFINFYNSICVE